MCLASSSTVAQSHEGRTASCWSLPSATTPLSTAAAWEQNLVAMDAKVLGNAWLVLCCVPFCIQTRSVKDWAMCRHSHWGLVHTACVTRHVSRHVSPPGCETALSVNPRPRGVNWDTFEDRIWRAFSICCVTQFTLGVKRLGHVLRVSRSV